MNLKQAAARLGIHYQTAYKLIRSGALPSVRIGGTYDISEAALERYLVEREIVRRGHVGAMPAVPARAVETTPQAMLAGLAETTRATSLSAQAAFDATARGLARTVRDCASVWMATDEDDEELHVVACDHWEPRRHSLISAYTRAVPLSRGEGYTGHVFATGRRIFAPHVPQNVLRAGTRPEFVQYLDELAIHSLIAVPVVVAGAVAGVVSVVRDYTSTPFAIEDLAAVQEAARLVGLAVERAALVRQGWRRRDDLLESLRLDLDPDDAVRPRSTVLEMVLDPHLRVVAANDAAFELLGEHPTTVVQQLLTTGSSSDALPLADRMLRGELDFHDDELVIERTSGERDHLLVQRGVARTPGSEAIGVVIVASPVAEVCTPWPVPVERDRRHHLDPLPPSIVPHGSRRGMVRTA
ncbi:MAG TPA: GAF domain-containing protein [Acidimicrobiia bacterium]|nr:GAF domain-containing protein [Acidimicrobiia bacterium]